MIKIRECSERDLSPTSALLQDVYAQPPYNETWSRSKAAEYLATFFRFDPKRCFVAIDQGHIVGAIFSYGYPWNTGTVLFIQELFVSERERCKGIGRGLVAKAVDTTANGTTIALIVREGTAAAGFYEKLGLSKNALYVLRSGPSASIPSAAPCPRP